jgi:ABC-2 type transport system ATP-binding protein
MAATISYDRGAVLELFDIHKRYGSVPALNGLALQLHRGHVYGFLGRNGAGKSTALRIVMGITRADRGSVALFGEPAKASDVRPRQRIGYVAQEQHFYDWMTPDRLGRFVGAFYPTWDEARYTELLRRFEIPARKSGTFSGGMKVKLALALALAHRPELLVLDEPTAGLDAVVRREFIDILRELAHRGDHTTLFSSHLIDEVELVANRVGIVENGRLHYEGSLPDLASRVRVVALPREAGETGPSSAGVRALLADRRARVLMEREGPRELELSVWADDPVDFLALIEQFPDVRLRQPPLEDIFIAVVRSRSNELVPGGAPA